MEDHGTARTDLQKWSQVCVKHRHQAWLASTPLLFTPIKGSHPKTSAQTFSFLMENLCISHRTPASHTPPQSCWQSCSPHVGPMVWTTPFPQTKSDPPSGALSQACAPPVFHGDMVVHASPQMTGLMNLLLFSSTGQQSWRETEGKSSMNDSFHLEIPSVWAHASVMLPSQTITNTNRLDPYPSLNHLCVTP